MRSIFRILGSAKELWPYYAGIVACSLAVAVAVSGLLTPFIIKAATDYFVAANQGEVSGTVIWLAATLLAADLANTVLSNIGGYLGDTMAANLRARLSGRYFAKLLSLPERYSDGELTGTVVKALIPIVRRGQSPVIEGRPDEWEVGPAGCRRTLGRCSSRRRLTSPKLSDRSFVQHLVQHLTANRGLCRSITATDSPLTQPQKGHSRRPEAS